MDIEKISKYLLTTVLKLLKGVPDLWRADVSRIIKELKEMVELESHAGERQRSVIRAHREFLVDEAVERLAYETYTRKGLRFWANQQELVCGYFSLFLVGGLYGIDVGLLLLVCVMSQDMNGAAAVGKLLIAFAVTASSTILAAMIGKRIYTHVALRKQFRLDILERIRDGGSGMDASFTQAMEKSYRLLSTRKREEYGNIGSSFCRASSLPPCSCSSPPWLLTGGAVSFVALVRLPYGVLFSF